MIWILFFLFLGLLIYATVKPKTRWRIFSLLLFFSILCFFAAMKDAQSYEQEAQNGDHSIYLDWTMEMFHKGTEKCGGEENMKKLWINSVENKALLLCEEGDELVPYIFLNNEYVPYKGPLNNRYRSQ